MEILKMKKQILLLLLATVGLESMIEARGGGHGHGGGGHHGGGRGHGHGGRGGYGRGRGGYGRGYGRGWGWGGGWNGFWLGLGLSSALYSMPYWWDYSDLSSDQLALRQEIEYLQQQIYRLKNEGRDYQDQLDTLKSKLNQAQNLAR
jgi:hypothetical protein